MIVCVVAAVVLWQFFGSAAQGYVKTASLFRWWTSQWFDPGSETEHGLIVLAVSAWLFWRNLKQADSHASRAEESDSDGPRIRHSAFFAMLVGLGLHVIGFAAQQARVSIVALLIFAWGLLRLAGGRRWGAAAMFPLGFLVFAIPINVLDSAGFWLRMGVVRASAAVAHGLGIAVLRNGTQLLAPDGRYNYDVVAACSGVRSLTALAALAALAGYLSFRTWPRRALLLFLCAPLVYLGNVARLASIIIAAQLGGPQWGERIHDVMGIGVFVIVLGGLFLAIRAIERWWPETPDAGAGSAGVGDWRTDAATLRTESRLAKSAPESGAAHQPRLEKVRWRTAVVIAGVAVGEMLFLHHLATMSPRGGAGVNLTADGANPVELPAFLGTEWAGRRVEVSAVEREILPPDTGFSRKNYLSLNDPRQQVFVSIVLSGRDRTSIHRPEMCLVGQGWTITGATGRSFVYPASDGRPAHPIPATLLRVQRSATTTTGQPRPPVPQIVAYWFVNADVVVATHWDRFWHDAWNRVLHARADRWAYVLMQTDAIDGETAALARMQAVLDRVLPAFQKPLVSAP